MKLFTDVANAVLGLVLPLACPACGGPLPGGRKGRLCQACEKRLDPIVPPICRTCGAPLPASREPVCATCRHHPPAYERARAWGSYRGELKELVQRLKYHGRKPLAPALGALLIDAGRAWLDLTGYDFIVPVPLHRDRFVERGFNQAYLISRPLAAQARIPISRDVERLVPTASQVGLTAPVRRDNVLGSFALRAGTTHRYRGASILLVDDVVTTGATASACAAVLKEAGATRVDVLAVARAEPRDPR